MSGVIVHEWLARTGGSENVFETLTGMFPEAERYCLWNDSGDRFTDVHETALARTPLRRSKALALTLMPTTWRHLPRAEADWVLCSSHVFAHHARFAGDARDAPKLVYAHTPARYVWVPELDGRGTSPAARAMASLLKPVDRRRAQEATAIAANSRFVAERIERTWSRESVVIHPPVAVGDFSVVPHLTDAEQSVMDGLPSDFLLGVSRFVPYKRLDLVIEAGLASGIPVVLAGSGPDERRLRELAAERDHPVEIIRRPSFDLLRALYRAARAVVFPPVEDFGIVPVEAMAAGTPVVANAIGGASESVQDGVTGALVDRWEGAELAEAVARALGSSPDACTARASEFDIPVFEDRVRAWLAPYIGEGS